MNIMCYTNTANLMTAFDDGVVVFEKMINEFAWYSL